MPGQSITNLASRADYGADDSSNYRRRFALVYAVSRLSCEANRLAALDLGIERTLLRIQIVTYDFFDLALNPGLDLLYVCIR